MDSLRKRAILLLVSIITTFVLTRAYLHISPNSDFNVGDYNIHHLFTGLLLISIGGLPLVLAIPKGRMMAIAICTFGVGLSLALDEWVYLITTDGSNESYLLPISLWGGVVMIALASVYIGILYLFNR